MLPSMAGSAGSAETGFMIDTKLHLDLPIDATPGDPGSFKRYANELMRESLRKRDPEELIPFFCECDRADCFASVWLTGRTYDRLRKHPGEGPRAHRNARLSAVSRFEVSREAHGLLEGASR
jgi:hypothetical protein